MVQSGGRGVLRGIGGSGDDGFFFFKEREAEALLKSIVASFQFPFR